MQWARKAFDLVWSCGYLICMHHGSRWLQEEASRTLRIFPLYIPLICKPTLRTFLNVFHDNQDQRSSLFRTCSNQHYHQTSHNFHCPVNTAPQVPTKPHNHNRQSIIRKRPFSNFPCSKTSILFLAPIALARYSSPRPIGRSRLTRKQPEQAGSWEYQDASGFHISTARTATLRQVFSGCFQCVLVCGKRMECPHGFRVCYSAPQCSLRVAEMVRMRIVSWETGIPLLAWKDGKKT